MSDQPGHRGAGDPDSLDMPAEHEHLHKAAPETEEWPAHPYEGEGVGRRESLKGEELPPVPHEEGAAPPQGGAAQQ